MAGGNMGGLWFSLDIKSKIDAQLKEYSGKIKDFQKDIRDCQDAINTMSANLNKMAKGSDAWNKQKEAIASTFRLVDDLINKARAYENALGRVQNVSAKFNKGGVVAPIVTNNRLDPKPIEQAIERYEKIQNILKRINELQGQRSTASLDAQTGLGTSLAWEVYQKRVQEVDAGINKLKADLKDLGASGMSLSGVKSQLDSLYSVLGQFEQGNRRAADSTRQEREEEQRRARTLKDARVWFEQITAAMSREEAQERRNRDGIAATSRARQQAIQSLRQQMQAQADLLQSQKTGLGRLYVQGRNAGMDSSELENILRRYREISRELLNLRTMMQNPSSLSFADMMNVGRYTGASSNFLREASRQVGNLSTRTHEAASAARDLASAFNRIHDTAARSASVLSDIKNLFLQGGIVYGVQRFANSIVQTGGDIVQQHIALQSILGDVQKADELFAQTQQLALQSPFKFQELNRDVKQLAAFGVDTDRLYDTTKRLADVASGLGVSFERLGLAYGQTQSRSWLDGKELRQFAYAGLPMLEKIAELYNDERRGGRNNYTTSDVRTMITKRQVSFEDVDKIFQRLTDEGGQFYNMQFVLSETLLGRWNKLEDAWSIMLGKFADGKSIVGQVFATAINGATEFVLQLDKISPMLLSAGAVFGGKKMFGSAMGAMGLGISSLTKQMALAEQSALKTFATRQMQDVTERKITAEMARQNILKQKELLSSASVRELTYLQLAAEGRLSVMQMGELARRGQISATTISQLQAMGTINKQQALLLNQLRAEGFVRKNNLSTMLQLGASNLYGKIGSFITPGNLLTVGATVGMALWMGYKQWSDKVNADAETMEKSAKQSAKRYGDFLNSLGDKGDGGLQKQVDSMKEILETSGDYTDTIKDQVEKAKSLPDQYDLLKKKIQGASQVSNMMSGSYGKVTAGANAATGLNDDWALSNLGIQTPRFLQWVNGLTNDSLETNVEDATNSLQRYQLMFDELDKNTQRSMESFIQSLASKNKELSNMIQGLPMAEQIRVLAFTGGDEWEAFVQKFGNGNEEVINWMGELSKRAQESSDDVSEIMYDDVPKGLEYIRSELGLSQEDFRKWAVKNPELFAAMMDEMARKANITSKTILYYFHKSISDLMNYDFWPKVPQGDGNGSPRPYRNGLSGLPIQSIRAALRGNGTMEIGKNVGEYDAKLRKVQDETWEKTAQNIQKEYKDARNEYDQISSYVKKQSGNVSKAVRAQMNGLKYQLNEWENIANAAGVSLDVGKNKTTGNFGKQRTSDQIAHKADNAAEKSLRARLQLIKEAYATYQKYYKLLHDEAEAAKVVSESYKDRGLSNDDVSKITSRQGYMQLVEDYLTRARNIQYRRPSDMQDRKDADIAAGVEEKNAQDYELLTEQINDFASVMSRDLDEMSRKWENYQNIYKSTGNAQLAASMSGLSRDYNGIDKSGYPDGSKTGFVQSYSDYLRNFLDNLILASNTPDKFIDYERLMGMSDKDIEKYAGGLFGTDDKSKIEGFATAFKKLKEIVTDKEFRQALDTFDSLMQQTVTQAGAQARNTAEHNENLNKLGMLREQGKISQTDYDQARAIEDANYEEKQLKASDDYKRFTDNIISMTGEMADDIKNKAIDVLDQKLQAGIITAKGYAEQVASISDKMSEFAEQQGAFESFLTGGIDGWLGHQLQSALSDLQYGAMLLSADPNSKEGRQTYQRGSQKLEQYRADRAEVKGWDNLNKSIQGASKAFNNLIGALQPLIDTATAFGNKGIAEGVGIAQKGVSSGLGVADSMNGLAGLAKAGGMDKLAGVVGQAGVWGAAAGAALSIGSSLINKFGFGAAANKRYEKQERYYKQMLSTMQDINSNLENRVSASYGSQSIQAARKLVSNYQAEAGEARDTFWDWSQAHTLHKNHRNRLYLFGDRGETSDYLSQINGFLRQNGYTGTNVGGDSIQNLDAKWLKLIKEDMPEAWACMNEEAREYLNNIIEAEGDTEKLKEATEKLNEVLTGMTFDGLRQNYASLLDDLSSDNDDFADNFEKTMREAILNSMIANLYKNQIEKAISDTAALAKNEEYVDRYGNIRRHTNRDKNGNLTYDEDDIASEYTADEYRHSMAVMAGITDGMTQVRDTLKSLYGWSDRESSSMSSSIQGMTEQTGDLLVSYLNAIRADVSVIRQLDGIYLPKLDITATAQLQQLNMITENTRRNADAAERIETAVNNMNDMFTRGFNGAKPLNVRVN